jgi:hypothetical protein
MALPINSIQENITVKEILTILINSIFNFGAYIAPAERSALTVISYQLLVISYQFKRNP